MKVGTKSILFGAHCFFLHPLFVAAAWWKLFGFPWDFRLWVCFFVHDLGYWGKPNMDGPEGEDHVFWGAKVMGWLFDYDVHVPLRSITSIVLGRVCDWVWGKLKYSLLYNASSWYCFSFYHSRFIAKRYGCTVSQFALADKMALVLEPWWLYLPRAKLSGELAEYIRTVKHREKDYTLGNDNLSKCVEGVAKESDNPKQWYINAQKYWREWVKLELEARNAR